MIIINKTKNAILAEDVFIADRLFTRAKGLLGRKQFNPGLGLLLCPCNSVHTFFMRFPIDLLFVDKNNKIVKAISCLKPFRITPIYFNASFVVELPSGTIQNTSTSQGDIITSK